MAKVHKHLHRDLHSSRYYMKAHIADMLQFQGKCRSQCKSLLKSYLFISPSYHGGRFRADARMRGRVHKSTQQNH